MRPMSLIRRFIRSGTTIGIFALTTANPGHAQGVDRLHGYTEEAIDNGVWNEIPTCEQQLVDAFELAANLVQQADNLIQ